MNVGSLFSGIGGLDHGLHRAGHRHVFLCESDPWRREVLAARFPGVPVYDDVRLVADGEPRSRTDRADVAGGEVGEPGRDGRPAGVDLLCGGFPCQDLSVAGQRRGLAGNRSGLFFEFARIADALRPGWLLVENVPGLLSSNGGRDFGTVLGTLADVGYGLAWRILDSRFFGVPQRRRRVFIVGARVDGDPRAAAERAGEVLAVGARCPGHPATRGEAREDVAGTLGGGAGSRGWASDVERMTFVANTLKSQRGKAGGGIGPEETLIAGPLGGGNDGAGRRTEDDPNLVSVGTLRQHVRPGSNNNHTVVQAASVRRLTPTECERLQALPDGWTDLGGTPDSRRYAALGDAVTASVAEWIGLRLINHVRASAGPA